MGKSMVEENTYSPSSDLVAQYHYDQGQLNGYCFNKNVEGILVFEADYQNGQRHGRFNKYYEDGSPKVLQQFSYDKMDGVKTVYKSTGEVIETKYHMGEKVN